MMKLEKKIKRRQIRELEDNRHLDRHTEREENRNKTQRNKREGKRKSVGIKIRDKRVRGIKRQKGKWK